jgi:hypothetical protein
MNKDKSLGYSAVELIGVLLVVSFIIYVTGGYINSLHQTRQVNQLTDQANNYSHQAIKYIEDNYRNLVQQSTNQGEIVLAWTSLGSYTTTGDNVITNNSQTPCLYITSGMPNAIRAYIIFGGTTAKSKKMNQQTIGHIAQAIGGNAGDLVNNNGNYVITGYAENEYNLSAATVNNIIQGCGFISPLPKDTLIINLTKDISMFASIKGGVDTQSTSDDPDPSLKKSGGTTGTNPLTTMQTNLYLDNVVKESTTHRTYYCDATQLPATDANSTCLNSASSQGISMYPGTASWISSVIDSTGQNCIATASAHFYSTTTGYSCNGVTFPSASSFCPATYNGQPQVSGSAYWTPQPGTLSGASCTANAVASYQNTTCLPITCNNSYNLTFIATYSNGRTVGDASYYNKCSFGVYIYKSSATGVYNYSTRKCDYTIRCRAGGNPADSWTDNSGQGISGGGSTTQSCGQKSVPANPTQQTNDLGFKNC